jgi:hypothetical protein
MPQRYKSEIRDGAIRDLISKVKKQDFKSYLRKIRLDKVRAFAGQAVDLDFPVTALIGTNGGGKSTILGAAAIAYKGIRPALFFPKSSIGDDSMSNWIIGYDIIDKHLNPTQPVPRRARFKNSKWARDDLIEREVLYFGIIRTVPAGERREFKRLATVNYFAIDQDAMKLAVALHIGAEKEGVVKKAIEEISLANRDPQLLFNQVGQRTGFIPSEIVSSAVVGLMD